MRHFTHPFYVEGTGDTGALTADGTLTYGNAFRFVEKTVQAVFADTPNATVTLEGTCDGANWVQISAITASALILVPQAILQLRIPVTSYVSGTFSAIFAGFDPRVGY